LIAEIGPRNRFRFCGSNARIARQAVKKQPNSQQFQTILEHFLCRLNRRKCSSLYFCTFPNAKPLRTVAENAITLCFYKLFYAKSPGNFAENALAMNNHQYSNIINYNIWIIPLFYHENMNIKQQYYNNLLSILDLNHLLLNIEAIIIKIV